MGALPRLLRLRALPRSAIVHAPRGAQLTLVDTLHGAQDALLRVRLAGLELRAGANEAGAALRPRRDIGDPLAFEDDAGEDALAAAPIQYVDGLHDRFNAAPEDTRNL